MQRIDFMMQRNDFVAKRPERQEISRLVLSLLNKKSIDTKSKLGKPRFEQKYCFLGHQSGIHLNIKIRMKNTIKQKMRPHRMKQECCWKGVSKNFSIRYRRKNPSWYSLLVHNLQWKTRKHGHWVFVNCPQGANSSSTTTTLRRKNFLDKIKAYYECFLLEIWTRCFECSMNEWP